MRGSVRARNDARRPRRLRASLPMLEEDGTPAATHGRGSTAPSRVHRRARSGLSPTITQSCAQLRSAYERARGLAVWHWYRPSRPELARHSASRSEPLAGSTGPRAVRSTGSGPPGWRGVWVRSRSLVPTLVPTRCRRRKGSLGRRGHPGALGLPMSARDGGYDLESLDSGSPPPRRIGCGVSTQRTTSPTTAVSDASGSSTSVPRIHVPGVSSSRIRWASVST